MSSERYRRAGVDTAAKAALIGRVRELAAGTRGPHSLAGVGGFGAAIAVPEGYRQPVIVSGADGVGTKLRLAMDLGRYDTVGIDCVAMCVDDIATLGATPLFFLDYLAMGRLDAKVVEQVVAGVAAGCLLAGCELAGGETAEMPGFYADGEFDLAGFAVGVVERARMLTPDHVHAGDRLVGLAADGLHSNGYSLARRIVADAALDLHERAPELGGEIGDELLRPTRIYAPIIVRMAAENLLHAAAHVTGGGIHENLPRALPEGFGARVWERRWSEPAVERFLRRVGDLSDDEARHVFNGGLGMVLVVTPEHIHRAIELSEEAGVEAWDIGVVERGHGVTVERR